jgi:RNA polymerase sigma-70 factor (ECF subfamily)
MNRLLHIRAGDREVAEDLTAEVFLKASRQLDTGRAQASIAAWLFTVARTVLTHHYRRYYRTGTCVSLDDARVAEMPDAFRHPERLEQIAHRVAEVLGTLPDRYRWVLELRFRSGYSIEETAQEMGVTPQNAKVIQHRAVAKAVQVGEKLP